MNDYGFSDLRIHMEEHFKVTVTGRMMDMFLELTGDANPLHVDKEFAAANRYPDRIVYGMLTASFISTLGGMYLPGKRCLIQSVESKFVYPVYIGDTLTVSGTVVELNGTVRQAVIRVLVTNQDNVKVLRGKLKVGFLNG